MDDSRKQPRGRDHHKKKKRKGLRARFDRRKNDERRRQQASKENIRSVDEQPVNTNSAVSLPEHWRKISSSTSTQYCKLENTLDGVCQVTASVVFSSEGAWNVYACGKKCLNLVTFSRNSQAVYPPSMPFLTSFQPLTPLFTALEIQTMTLSNFVRRGEVK